MEEKLQEKLIEQAIAVRKNAYVPYSNFAVGCAVLTKQGEIYTGCNIENSSYGLSNCAERTAIFKAVSEGDKDIKAIALVADTVGPCSPCGACRQVIIEFGAEIEVIMANLAGDIVIKKSSQLLWNAFSGSDLSR